MTKPSDCSTITCFGEVLLRLASPAPRLLFQDMQLEPSFCGAEANVAVALAGFGHRSNMVTTLPANPVGEAARATLRAMGVDTRGIAMDAGRMGLFYLQPGAMGRPPGITYDRSGSAFAMADPASFHWQELLEGADWLFISGITAALGSRALQSLREALQTARATGAKVAFDTNFRPSLWAGREALAAEIMRELAAGSDLVFAGRRAVRMIAGGDYDHPDPDEAFAAAAEVMFAQFPNIQHMAATRRIVHTSDRQDLTGLLADREGVSRSPTVCLEAIVDRVGTGDAFAAGILHGLLNKQTRTETIEFATACAQWAHSVPGDFLRARVEDIEAVASGSGDVKR